MGKKYYNIRNHIYYYDYYKRLKNIALSMFKWEGLPETCNERFLERCLFEWGQAVFVEDDSMSFLNLKVTPATVLNVYEEPTKFTAFSVGYSKEYRADECVWIKNNYSLRPTQTTVQIFAEKLARIDLSIDINVNAQKTPILIRTDEKTKASLYALYNQYDGEKPVIFGSKGLSDKPIEAISTGATYVADKLREEKRAVWNEAIEFFGLNTNPSDKKKERLIVSEVNANNEEIDIQFETMLLCRQKACENINKLFGLDVSVSKRVLQTESETVFRGWNNG